MPLLDHFQPPLSVSHPWKGFHSAWANAITSRLNEVLPEGFYAIPEVPLGNTVEIDVATLEEIGNGVAVGAGPATAVWAPPRPRLTAPVDFTRVHGVEVHVFQDDGGPRLRAAIELVSPSNKDRPRSRQTFAAKCVGYLEHGVAVVVIDTVTRRSGNLHDEIVRTLEAPALAWGSPTPLYAVAYRTAPRKAETLVEVWPEPLAVGQDLPALPLWIDEDLCLPLPLQASYEAACRSLRISL